MTRDIKFGQINLTKTSGLFKTDATGQHKVFQFKFTDQSLKLLLKSINTSNLIKRKRNLSEISDGSGTKENESSKDYQDKKDLNLSVLNDDKVSIQIKESILNYDPKIYFGNSLEELTAHSFLTFINNISS